jgi:energy-coupling factor transporter ATP-binding protein EcfA2
MPDRKFSKLTKIFLLVFFGTALGLLGELIPDVKKDLESLAVYLRLSYQQLWLLLVGISGLFLFIFTYLNEREEKPETNEIAESERDNIIESLTQSYENRLAQKLDRRITLKLQLKYAKEGTSEEYSETYFAQDAKNEKEIRTTLSAVLHKHLFLLIIGEPGAGKTTLLLDLAIAFLEHAKDDKSLPYPVILNLASWQKNKEFGEWIVDVLVEGNGFNRKLAQEVVYKKQILPFLDGLDEISDKDLRSDCLEKIQHFLPKYEPKKLVICSRINEYKEIIADAPVKAEVLVEQLTDVQIRKVLQTIINNPKKEMNRPFANPTTAQNMLKLMDKSSSFANVLCTPFYFNLASQILDTDVINDEIHQNENAWQDYLVEKFIERKLFEKSAFFPSPADNKQYLSWLAKQLKQHDLISFELSSFQPFFLKTPNMFYLAFGTVFGSFVAVPNTLFVGVFYGLISGLFCGLVNGVFREEIKTEDIRSWRWSNLFSLSSWGRILLLCLRFCLFFGLVGVFILSWFIGLAAGVFTGLLVGLICSLVGGFINEASNIIYFSKIQKPYQRLKRGVIFNMLLWASIVLISGFVIDLFNGYKSIELSYDYLFRFLFGIGIGFLLSPISEHFVLRLCFYLEGSIPMRLGKFLNYAAELRILESDGGHWRFRHKILQDYFARLQFSK